MSFNFYPLGTIAPATEPALMLGMVREFEDKDYSLPSNKQSLLSGQRIRARWVKNDSGGTLSKSTIVLWKSGYAGTRVHTVTGSGGVGAGVVDPFITTTVADGEYFWLITGGPCTLLSSTTTAANSQVIPTSSGKYVIVPDTAAGSLAVCGRVLEGSDGDAQYKKALVYFRSL